VDTLRTIRLRWLQGELGEIAWQLTRIQTSKFAPGGVWRPAINAYRCERGMRICVDLAGVDKTRIDLTAEPRRLLIRGFRQPPEPGAGERPVQVLAMEIDYGPFEREVPLPISVEVEKITAEQRNGLLWISLPAQGADGPGC